MEVKRSKKNPNSQTDKACSESILTDLLIARAHYLK